jgi:flagellar biosynthesis GTPase FlhF
MKARTAALVALCLVSLSPAGAVAESYYKWVDDEGVTHYGTDKPKDIDAEKVRTYGGASSSQARELQELEQKREARQQAREKAAEEEALAERREEEPEKLKKELCDKHRENLETLVNKPTVRVKNSETGEMEVIDDERREELIQKTKAELEKCNQ